MLLTKNSCRTCHTSFKTFGRWDPTKEYRLSHLCSFETGDIRKKIKELNNFDIIILGAIGQVFGDYFTTLTILDRCLKKTVSLLLTMGWCFHR
ncbi:hypothetical protein ING2E5B_1060 [Fermentimonas caenicola]|jgi:hypothetical protein|uniref:Uncharacterized protein n=1 Tax=Fermentimonas caenicola TaxID=1562970 RepID=A0A098C068_9BACT|nr:hypothetical protein ING2E5B_1060 [Fermentimonas caenicola]